MNLFKKATASVALVALVSGVFSTGVSAYNAADLAAAESLATAGVINTQATAGGYNLDSTITRGEIAKVAANVADITPFTTCEGKFSDVSATVPNTWVCGYVEALLAAGKVSANAEYNSERNLSKAEALKLMLEAAGHTDIYTNGATWQEEVVAYAVSNDVLASSFSDYNTSALRGWVFNVADTAMNTEDEIDLPGIIPGIDDIDTDETTDTTDPVVTPGDNELVVTLSANTPNGATVPGKISGLPVAKFDFTAGSEDVTISALTVKRTGLSNASTLTALAIFSEEGRASKSKDDTQENNTQAELTLSNGGLVVKAGETQTLTVVADIASQTAANGTEFAIELLNVNASSEVAGLSGVVGETMKVGGVDAATLVVKADSSVSDVKVGDEQVEIFKFKIEGDSDEDVVLNAITFKGEGSVDEEDELANYSLEFDGEVVATSTTSNGKYVTFNLEEGVTIKEDKTEKFVVKADIVAGVTETISFKIDKTLDVTAVGTKFGFGSSVDISAVESEGPLGSVKIDAGELTLVDVDAASDKLRADKKDVELGTVKVTNVSGAALELQKLAVKAVANSGGVVHADTILENVEVEINGTSYTLDYKTASGTFENTDLDVKIPEGVTTLLVKADTKKEVNKDTTVQITVENIGTTGFYIVETEEDEKVTDITPSSLSFKKLTFISAGAELSTTPLADTTVVRGAVNEIANQFQVEASEASAIVVDEVNAKLMLTSTRSGSTNLITSSVAANKFVSEVALYKGSVSDANLLDRISGSKISNDGSITFDGFKVSVAADQEQNFVATVSFVDGVDVEDKFAKINVTTVSAEDDDSDDVTVTGNGQTSKDIEVKGQGSLSFTTDTQNEDNKETKTILGGESVVVYSVDALSTNESVDVEKVVFTVSQDIREAVTNASLYLGDKLIATNSNSDITATTITFDKLTTLIVSEETEELKLKLNTSTIGYQKVGKTLQGVTITNVAVDSTDAEGVNSGKELSGNVANSGTSKGFSIVPATVVPSVVSTFGTESKFKLTVNDGANSASGSNADVVVDVKSLVFSTVGSSYAGAFDLYVDGESAGTATATPSTNVLTFNNLDTLVGSGAISGNETFVLVPTGTTKDLTISVKLVKDGVTFDVTNVDASTGLKSNMNSELNLGSKTY